MPIIHGHHGQGLVPGGFVGLQRIFPKAQVELVLVQGRAQFIQTDGQFQGVLNPVGRRIVNGVHLHIGHPEIGAVGQADTGGEYRIPVSAADLEIGKFKGVDIPAHAAGEMVDALAAVDDVVPGTPVDGIVSGTAHNGVVPGITHHHIVHVVGNDGGQIFVGQGVEIGKGNLILTAVQTPFPGIDGIGMGHVIGHHFRILHGKLVLVLRKIRRDITAVAIDLQFKTVQGSEADLLIGIGGLVKIVDHQVPLVGDVVGLVVFQIGDVHIGLSPLILGGDVKQIINTFVIFFQQVDGKFVRGRAGEEIGFQAAFGSVRGNGVAPDLRQRPGSGMIAGVLALAVGAAVDQGDLGQFPVQEDRIHGIVRGMVDHPVQENPVFPGSALDLFPGIVGGVGVVGIQIVAEVIHQNIINGIRGGNHEGVRPPAPVGLVIGLAHDDPVVAGPAVDLKMVGREDLLLVGGQFMVVGLIGHIVPVPVIGGIQLGEARAPEDVVLAVALVLGVEGEIIRIVPGDDSGLVGGNGPEHMGLFVVGGQIMGFTQSQNNGVQGGIQHIPPDQVVLGNGPVVFAHLVPGDPADGQGGFFPVLAQDKMNFPTVAGPVSLLEVNLFVAVVGVVDPEIILGIVETVDIFDILSVAIFEGTGLFQAAPGGDLFDDVFNA